MVGALQPRAGGVEHLAHGALGVAVDASARDVARRVVDQRAARAGPRQRGELLRGALGRVRLAAVVVHHRPQPQRDSSCEDGR